MKKMKRLLTLAVLVTVLFVCSPAQTKKPAKVLRRGIITTVIGTTDKPAPKLSPEVQRRYDAFITVWTTIRDHYFDPTYSNLNWNSVRTEFEPLIKGAKSDSELHRLLQSMLGKLNRSHLEIIPPEVYQVINAAKAEVKAREKARTARSGLASGDDTDSDLDEDATSDADDASTRYGIGVELTLINDRFVITRMDPNSAAEYAGLKRGFVIDKVNGVSMQAMMDRVLIHYAARSNGIKQFVPAEVVTFMLNGKKDSYVDVSYLDENDELKEAHIRREPLRESALVISPNLPEQRLSFEARSLDDATGYIRFNVFAVPVIEKFCSAIGEFRSKELLVIDLRGNIGGVLAVIPTLAGMLTADSIDLGTSIYRFRSEPLKALSKAKNYKGKIIVLVDDRTASAAEIFALSLRENGRALVIGQRTAGMALPSITVKLPTDAVLLYPFANYRSASGSYIEGVGIKPDREIVVDRKTLLAGKDAQLDLAITTFADTAAFADLKPKQKSAEITPERLSILGSAADISGPPPAAKTTASGTGLSSGPPPSPKKAPAKSALLSTPLPPPSAVGKREFKPGQDTASKRYIDEFLKKIGGSNAVKTINRYSARGTALLGQYGSSVVFRFSAFRDGPEKYSEIYASSTTGEVREIFNGKSHHVQTDFGLDMDLPDSSAMTFADLFSPVLDLASAEQLYASLSYAGSFDREGRNAAVLEGMTKDGAEVALAFDVETGLLVNLTRGYISISLGDYRKVGEVMLPFKIDRGRVGNMSLEDVTVNSPIDASLFLKKERCFDKVN